jgi:hypothetical protein
MRKESLCEGALCGSEAVAHKEALRARLPSLEMLRASRRRPLQRRRRRRPDLKRLNGLTPEGVSYRVASPAVRRAEWGLGARPGLVLGFEDAQDCAPARLAIAGDQKCQDRSLEGLQDFFDGGAIGQKPHEQVRPQALLLLIK